VPNTLDGLLDLFEALIKLSAVPFCFKVAKASWKVPQRVELILLKMQIV
jgi:hypothetical protein